MNKSFEQTLRTIFEELNRLIKEENGQRRSSGVPVLSGCDIKILGQLCLLSNPSVNAILDLQHTGDLDALLEADYFIIKSLKSILPKYGLVYDEDSAKVWIPPESHFTSLFEFQFVEVFLLDPESALVSKAVKARGKNKQLIQDAIATDKFPRLVERIVAAGGILDFFLED